MIYDNIRFADRYDQVGGNLWEALEYLKTTDFSRAESGKWSVNGEKIKCTLMDKTVEAPCEIWESHKNYADIHFLIEGSELFRVADENSAEEITAYSAEKDCTFYRNTGESLILTLRPGDFVVQYPGEIHQPNNVPECGKTRLRKVIVKVYMGE